MTTFIKGQRIFRGDIAYDVVRPIDEFVQLENVLTGELSNKKLDDLLDEYRLGYLRIALPKYYEPPPPSLQGMKDKGISCLSEAARTETRRRVSYLVELNKREAFEGSQKSLIQAIREVGLSLGDQRPPHYTTVYRWRKRYLKASMDVRSLFAKLYTRGGKGQNRLHPEVEAIIEDKIENVFLASKSSSAEAVHDAVCLAIEQVNAGRLEGERLKVPGFRTIQRRIGEINAYDVAVARYGIKEAERRYALMKCARKVSRILELVEIDHTPIDIMVVDEDGIVIGRPILTVIFDRFSRCVLGFSISLAGHGTHAVFEAVRHALLPKTYLKTRYPDLDLSWECYGWFEKLLMDNGPEFHGLSTVDAMLTIGIIGEYAASREPNDKPFVERFLKTFNYSFIHRLPGTTLAKLHKRIGFKAEDEACITLEELNRLTHIWIIDVYHRRPHRGLGGQPPIEVWKESASAFPPQLKLNSENLEIELSEIAESSLQHYGIDLNTFRYVSPELLQLRRLLQVKAKVLVKWPSYDVGYIWVWDPLEKRYLKAENTDQNYAGLTIEQAKTAKALIAKDPGHQRTRASASEVIRQESNEAMRSKRLKVRKQGARMANKTAKELNREMVSDLPVPPTLTEQNDIFQNDPIEAFEMEVIGESEES
ncbi:Mu transposase C-terminal domain-containing protein [Chromobacterium haemolyticum]|uniref:Mu transposase C-terminal domain-containing protein n=1 Tax=Chromobacterium TaxID=535 RepID=UPI004055C32B